MMSAIVKFSVLGVVLSTLLACNSATNETRTEETKKTGAGTGACRQRMGA